MIWNLEKFNKEKAALKKLAFQKPLSPLRKGQIKQAILYEISSAHANSAPADLVQPARNFMFMRYMLAGILGVSLIGGTAFASSSSLPGEILYPVKKAKEKIEVKLAASTEAKAKLQTEFAEERLNELNKIKERKLLSAKPKDKLSSLKIEQEAENNVQNAIQTLTEVKTKLEDKGNAQAALKIDRTLVKLRDRNKNRNEDGEDGDVKGINTEIGAETEKREDDAGGRKKNKRNEDKINTIAPIPTPSLTTTASGSNQTIIKTAPAIRINRDSDVDDPSDNSRNRIRDFRNVDDD